MPRPALLLAALAAGIAGCRAEAAPKADSTGSDLAGTWTVVGHVIPGVSAMSDGEAARWHGRALRLDVSRAVTEGNHCDRPTYATRRVARAALLGGEFKLPPDRLPALAALDSLTLLEVGCGGAPWTAMGGRLIAIDATRAYAPWDGVFFELARAGDFRAVGQEPGWSLDISHGEAITFTYTYGESRAVTPVPVPTTDAVTGARVYHAVTESSDLRITIEPRACTDAMSGKPFETTVTVTLNGQAYRGCGGPLPSIPPV